MKYAWGIADCVDCKKWHPVVVDEPDGSPTRIGGLQCNQCPGMDTCRFLRVGVDVTEDGAVEAVTEWLLENGATWKGQPEAKIFLWPTDTVPT